MSSYNISASEFKEDIFWGGGGVIDLLEELVRPQIDRP